MRSQDPIQAQPCTARRKNGQPCGAKAIRGGTVCRMHGGGAPQVKAAAAARLRAMVDPALGLLQYPGRAGRHVHPFERLPRTR